jgi:hypothetical protein
MKAAVAPAGTYRTTTAANDAGYDASQSDYDHQHQRDKKKDTIDQKYEKMLKICMFTRSVLGDMQLNTFLRFSIKYFQAGNQVTPAIVESAVPAFYGILNNFSSGN